MTIKTITTQIQECDHCGKNNYHNAATFENNSEWCEEKNIHICDDCGEEFEFAVWHKRDILKGEKGEILIEDEDKDWTMTWGLTRYDQVLNTYVFVKWLK